VSAATHDRSLPLSNDPLWYEVAWDSVFECESGGSLEKLLPDYLRARPWFGGNAHSIQRATVLDVFQV
jgi:hypothetical protein